MSIKYMISMDSIKTCVQGALGAMTFGMYHQFTTNKIMKQQEEINQMKLDDINQQIRQLLQENKEIKNENKEIKNENTIIKERMNKGWFY